MPKVTRMPVERAFSLGSGSHSFRRRRRNWAWVDAGDGGDVFAVGSEHDDAEAGDGDRVAGVDDAARGFADGFEVRGVVVAGNVGVFAVDAMIEEFADLHMLDEFRHAAHVIDVEVGDEHVIEAGDAGIVHGGLDAANVAAV